MSLRFRIFKARLLPSRMALFARKWNRRCRGFNGKAIKEITIHESRGAQNAPRSFEAGKAPDPCPGCGEVSDKNAAICKNCMYVYQPLKAYEAGLIEYGHVAMERLSAEERRKAIQIKKDREKAKREAERRS